MVRKLIGIVALGAGVLFLGVAPASAAGGISPSVVTAPTYVQWDAPTYVQW